VAVGTGTALSALPSLPIGTPSAEPEAGQGGATPRRSKPPLPIGVTVVVRPSPVPPLKLEPPSGAIFQLNTNRTPAASDESEGSTPRMAPSAFPKNRVRLSKVNTRLSKVLHAPE
jgi:hypothetical protein